MTSSLCGCGTRLPCMPGDRGGASLAGRRPPLGGAPPQTSLPVPRLIPGPEDVGHTSPSPPSSAFVSTSRRRGSLPSARLLPRTRELVLAAVDLVAAGAEVHLSICRAGEVPLAGLRATNGQATTVAAPCRFLVVQPTPSECGISSHCTPPSRASEQCCRRRDLARRQAVVQVTTRRR